MSTPTRDYILSEIRRLTESGKAPGRQTFERETGIRMAEWLGVYWARWGDAVAEAGGTPNGFQGRTDDDTLFSKYALAVRHFGRVPTNADLRLYKRAVDSSLPSHSSFESRGTKEAMLAAFWSWAETRNEYADLLPLRKEPAQTPQGQSKLKDGYVYLIKSGSFFKIGRSDALERRVKEIRLALPDAATLEHTIRTDDPPGIEAYWHRRFAECRANGEWFKLSSSDVAAFKRRKMM